MYYLYVKKACKLYTFLRQMAAFYRRCPISFNCMYLIVDQVLNVEYPWYEQIIRQEMLTSNCDALGLSGALAPSGIQRLEHILVDHKYKLLYCYVPKVACTNWKRVLMVLDDQTDTNVLNIPASVAHANGTLLRLNQLNQTYAYECLNNYTRFIVVRHPFERLLSAYRNKLEGHRPSSQYFQARIGRYIIKKYRRNATATALERGDDVTFREFVQYLTTEGMSNGVNEHWRPMYQMCEPCTVNYTFIGRYERLMEDARSLLDLIGAADRVQFPETKPSNTRDILRFYLAQLSLNDIERLYDLYRLDFKLFDYSLQDVLGYDVA